MDVKVASLIRCALVASALCAPAMARAQRSGALTVGARNAGAVVASPEANVVSTESVVPRPSRAGAAPTTRRASWWSPLASVAVPGSGQLALRQQRAVAYLATEGYLWVQFASQHRDGGRQRERYQAIARDVARTRFGGPTPDGVWDYYELMEKFQESGAFNLGSGTAVLPETDVSTYNGQAWMLARLTYWSDPDVPPPVGSREYQAALDFYTGRAIRPEFRWSWKNAQLEQDEYRRTISRSNEAFRRSVTDLGMIIANHMLSGVDAFVNVRLNRSRTPSGVPGLGFEASAPWAPFGRSGGAQAGRAVDRR